MDTLSRVAWMRAAKFGFLIDGQRDFILPGLAINTLVHVPLKLLGYLHSCFLMLLTVTENSDSTFLAGTPSSCFLGTFKQVVMTKKWNGWNGLHNVFEEQS